MALSYTIQQLANLVGGTLRGRSDAVITGVNDVLHAENDQATWITNPKFESKLKESRAGVVLVQASHGETPLPAILCERVDRSVARLLGAFSVPISRPTNGIHATAVIHPSVRLGLDCAIGPHVVIEEDVEIGRSCLVHAGVFIGRGTQIGEKCVFWPNVVIRDGCIVGNRVSIHMNSVIGSDGFGFYFDEGRHTRVPHIGGVRIEDDVEIGACTCVDRAKFGFTVIGRGTKIDNQVQIAHNVKIGEHCILAGQAGLSGSIRLGDNVIIGGRAALVDNLEVERGARLAFAAVITKDVPAGTTVSGSPAQEHYNEMRMQARIRRLPQLIEQVRELTARIQALEASAHHRP